MTDADLLRLIEEKLPSDFTEAELAALRSRLKESEEIRSALAATLELETELATGLADVSLSVDDLLMRAASRKSRTPASSRAWWVYVGLVGVVLAIGLGIWWSTGKGQEPNEIIAVNTPKPDISGDAAPPSTAKETEPAKPEEPAKSAEAVLSATMPSETTAPVAPPAVPVEGPWTPWLNGELAPRPVDDPAWRADLRTMGHDEISLAEFQRWWGEIPGVAAGWNEAIIGNRRTVQIDGRMQLKAPWVDDTVLRLTPFDLTDMTLLFGDQERGVALRFYRQRDPHIWAAYEFQRPPGETTIKWGGLLTTDGGAWHRSAAVTFEVRRQDGMLILSTGQIPILTVPLPNAPQTVQLLGRGRLRGFSWQRGEPWPVRERQGHPIVLKSGDPESTKWQSVKPETAMVHTDANGAVSLTGSSKTDDAQSYVVLPKTTLVESIVRLSTADAGTGVYLGNEQGKPIALLGVFQDNRTKQLAFGPLRPGDRRIETEYDPNAFPPPYWSPNVWLRIVAGLGMCHVWTSGDGVHWGHIAENPMHDVNGAVGSIGLYCFPGETPRTIRMDSFQVCELSGITRIADEPDEALSPKLPATMPSSYEEWEAAFVEQLPDGFDPARWMEQSAVATLKAGPSRSLGREIIERLAESARFRTLKSGEQREFLDDAGSLIDGGHEPSLAVLRRGYFTHADQAPEAARGAWGDWLQSPVWTHHAGFKLQREFVMRHLLASAFANDRDAIGLSAPDAQFWIATGHPDHRFRAEDELIDRVARWSRSVTGVGDRQGDSAELLPLGWRHPLQLTVNKEAYNVRSELRSALLGGNFDDAGRIAMNFGISDGVGLLPDMNDDHLFVSIPVAMATAVKDYPAFGEALKNDLGPTGLVRVTQAARRGDLPTLRAATIQFYGTAAAAEAERVLGDRQMALGDYFGARRCYLHAQHSASDDQRELLRVRILLAEAMQKTRTTAIDPAELSALKLDGVPIAPLLQEANPTVAPPPPPVAASAPPRRSRYKVEIKGQFDGQVGQNAGKNEFRNVDAFGRQFAVTVDAQRFYISNRFQVTAYQRDNGQQIWAASVGSDQGESHGHRFTPMSPLLADGKLLIRRMTKAGIELACLKPEDGQVIWKARGGDKTDVLSEPVILPGRVGVLVGQRVDEDVLEIRWTHLAPTTGDVLAEFPLVRLRDTWNGEVPCALTVRDDRAVAVVGGVVVGFEATGTLLWVRRETWLPPKIDPLVDDYLVSVPHFVTTEAGASVIVTAPNSREVLGFDFATGRLQWRSIRPELQGVLAATEQAVVLAETDGLTALAADSGEVLWTRPLPDRLTGTRVDGDRLLVTLRQNSVSNKAWPQLAWFDLATGTPRGEAMLELEDQPDWSVGPFFTVGDAWWTLIGRPGTKPQREIALLVPASDAPPQSWSDLNWGDWLSSPPGERRMVQSILPGWQAVASGKNAFSAPTEPVREQRPVLVAKLNKASDQIRFVRTVKIGSGDSASLHLRVGHQAGQKWQLEVRVGGRSVLNEPVTDESAPNGWLDTHVSLFPFAGQTVTLQIILKNLDGKSAEGLWREVRLTGCEVP